MRDFYPVARFTIVAILLLIPPIFVNAADKGLNTMVSEDISVTEIEQNLQSQSNAYLSHMLANPQNRLEYVEALYADKKLEETAAANSLSQSQPVLEALRIARKKILFAALMEFELDKMTEDIEALARERYDSDPSEFQARKRIKMAFIFVKKEPGSEDQAKTTIEDIASQLKAQPANVRLFYELAEKYSDDKTASDGGVIKKWLIAPPAEQLAKKAAILQATFALESAGLMTEIEESGQGYSIARLLKMVPARQLRFGEVKFEISANIRSQLYRRKEAEVKMSLLANEDYFVEDEAVKEIISAEIATRETAKRDD